MPYWNKRNWVQVASNGMYIYPGDILQHIDDKAPEKYFVCRESSYFPDTFEIVDCCNGNTGMCVLGIDGNVINLGHYKNNIELVKKEGLLNIEQKRELDLFMAKLLPL